MANGLSIRSAMLGDAESLAAIYAPYVRDTAVSFEVAPPTTAEFAKRIEDIQERYPYLVAEQDGTICGYAYAGPFKPRAAYALSAELSVYVDRPWQGKGVGRALYGALESELAVMGVTNLYACVAYPRVEDEYLTYASVRFHERMGFKIVGRFHGCARKSTAFTTWSGWRESSVQYDAAKATVALPALRLATAAIIRSVTERRRRTCCERP
ncbi:MAG: GNAT family N-acetyltransferase [Atopobiaceae bacterium]|nr:GNAT family N-acetyltransferase [Atopobiaceae bacterium]MBR3314578.1 GNAT family N-acetyltransferase [Atopobiaceae bacterium]